MTQQSSEGTRGTEGRMQRQGFPQEAKEENRKENSCVSDRGHGYERRASKTGIVWGLEPAWQVGASVVPKLQAWATRKYTKMSLSFLPETLSTTHCPKDPCSLARFPQHLSRWEGSEQELEYCLLYFSEQRFH